MNRWLYALVLLGFTQQLPAVDLGAVELSVDQNAFYFSVDIVDVSTSATSVSFGMYTKFGSIVIPGNQEKFVFSWDASSGNTLDGPRVEPIGVPGLDRWVDGTVPQFSLTGLGAGAWRLSGAIPHGADAYRPCDRLGELRFNQPGVSLVSGGTLIEGFPVGAMSLSKSSSTKIVRFAGQVVDYKYVIVNTGPLVLHGVAVSDNRLDAPPACAFAGAAELAPAGEAGSKVVCTAQYTVTADDLAAGARLGNTATATSDEADPVMTSLWIPVGLFGDGFEGRRKTAAVVDGTACEVGRFTSLAIGADGLPIISYDRNTPTGLKVAKCTDAACTDAETSLATLDESAANSTSLAIGVDGRPVIAYQQGLLSPEKALYVARCDDPACSGGAATLSVVDDPDNDVGRYPSIGIGQDDWPVISYWDSTAPALKVAKCNDPACTGGDETISVVDDAAGAVGPYSSLAVGLDGLPVISYQRQIPGGLKVAKCNDPACTGGNETISIVDASTDSVGSDTSIAIGTDGFPVISYMAPAESALKIAKCNDPACSGNDEQIEVLDSQAGGSTSLAIGVDGFPVIAYMGSGGRTVRLVKCNDAACAGGDEQVRQLSSDGGWWVSLAIGADGFPVISYYDSSEAALKVVHCVSASCD